MYIYLNKLTALLFTVMVYYSQYIRMLYVFCVVCNIRAKSITAVVFQLDNVKTWKTFSASTFGDLRPSQVDNL